MKKFGFSIRTRGGSTVDGLVIHGRDAQEAEKKLRQVYHHCTVLAMREVAEQVDANDVEGVISLIAAEGSDPGGGSPGKG
jgi:hypothetical protein